MGLRKKYKRKIVVKGEAYWWNVKESPDYVGNSLYVISENKKFIVSYQLGQSESYQLKWTEKWQPPFAIIMGESFGGLSKNGCWQRVRTPLWDNDTIITPFFVRRLIEWSLDEQKQIVLVDWQGVAIDPF